MGANQSDSKVQTAPALQDHPNGHFGISVSGQMIEKGIAYDNALEQKLQDAYQKGKTEGISTIQHTLSEVASQTFDQINNQLSELQAKHIDHSKEMAQSLGAKILLPTKTATKACSDESLSLISCLEMNKSKSLACSELVDAYSTCSYNALVSTKRS